MSAPWFDPNHYSWIAGTALGCLGGLMGGLCGALAPRGKAKVLVIGLHLFCLLVSLVLAVVGTVAYFGGQPYGIWYGLGFPGGLGLILFGGLWPLTRRGYTIAELRKSQAADL